MFFSTNRVKIVARTPTETLKKGTAEGVVSCQHAKQNGPKQTQNNISSASLLHVMGLVAINLTVI